MELDAAACYRALKTRDRRFDGRFFTGVASTGIYCRPVCPARTPKRENCQFFPCAAAAQDAGFRPCLRCRPETSPGSSPWLGTSGTVRRALRLISEGALDTGDTEELAARLGVGERHLRRLFAEHLGTSPRTVALTRRIHFAKRLIDETTLRMSDIALAAGFASIRRFNDAILSTYRKSPSQLRRHSEPRSADNVATGLTLRLPFRPPLQWDALLRFLKVRAIPGVEEVDTACYRRTISISKARGSVEVRLASPNNHLQARIHLSDPAFLIQVVTRLRRIFDLDCEPEQISAHLKSDARLAKLVEAQPGLRIPGGWDGFEIAVRAILGQQVSVVAATTLAGRLAQRFGAALGAAERRSGSESLTHFFPGPEVLAETDLTGLGMPQKRAAAVSTLSAAVRDGSVLLDGSRDLTSTLGSLKSLPGIGDWTAQYIAMRALREPDAFPASDLGVQRALQKSRTPVTASEVERIAAAWRPWRAYGVIYLWNEEANHAAVDG